MLISLIACSEDVTIQAHSHPEFSKITEVVYWINETTGDSTVVGFRAYIIDSGFVTEIQSIESHVFFDYNDEGKLIRYRDEKDTIIEFLWENENCIAKFNNASIYLKYDNSNLVKISNKMFEYSGENVTAVYINDTTLQREFLNYNTTIIHPDYYLKSIEPWIASLYNRPISKNIFEIRRDQPYWDDDVYSGLYDYHNNYKIIDKFRVRSISPEWSIFTWYYEFYQ